MNKINKYNWLTIISSIVVCSFFLSSCIDRDSPIFKKNAKNASKRQTQSTQNLINKSANLQQLDRICRKLPYFEKINPSIKGISKKNDTLFYYYYLENDFEKVKVFLKKELLKDGWELKKENSGFWEDQIEFQKETYWIRITNGKFGDNNYATNCKDLKVAN